MAKNGVGIGCVPTPSLSPTLLHRSHSFDLCHHSQSYAKKDKSMYRAAVELSAICSDSVCRFKVEYWVNLRGCQVSTAPDYMHQSTTIKYQARLCTNECLLLGPSHRSVHNGTQMPKWLEAHHLCMASCEFVSFAEDVCPIAWHHVMIFLNARWAESQTCTVIMRPYGPSCTLLCSKVFFELSDWLYCFLMHMGAANGHRHRHRLFARANIGR